MAPGGQQSPPPPSSSNKVLHELCQFPSNHKSCRRSFAGNWQLLRVLAANQFMLASIELVKIAVLSWQLFIHSLSYVEDCSSICPHTMPIFPCYWFSHFYFTFDVKICFNNLGNCAEVLSVNSGLCRNNWPLPANLDLHRGDSVTDDILRWKGKWKCFFVQQLRCRKWYIIIIEGGDGTVDGKKTEIFRKGHTFQSICTMKALRGQMWENRKKVTTTTVCWPWLRSSVKKVLGELLKTTREMMWDWLQWRKKVRSVSGEIKMMRIFSKPQNQ